MDNITNSSCLVVIDSRVIPDVFLKVLEVKKTIANREARSLAAACKQSGISRSAYYKYKDYVFLYDEQHTQRIITVYAVLKDKPGVLATVLDILRNAGANVLTINQNMPIESVAPVCLSISETENSQAILNAVEKLRLLDEVIDAKLM